MCEIRREFKTPPKFSGTTVRNYNELVYAGGTQGDEALHPWLLHPKLLLRRGATVRQSRISLAPRELSCHLIPRGDPPTNPLEIDSDNGRVKSDSAGSQRSCSCSGRKDRVKTIRLGGQLKERV